MRGGPRGNIARGSFGRGNIARGNSDRRCENTNAVMLCQFCGKQEHSLSECSEFVQNCLQCVWCGGTEHASYQCQYKPGASMSGNERQSTQSK